MADANLPHVTRAKFFRNGDPNFKGKVMVVNPRYYRNFESFLDTVTSSTQATNAVTRICTPHGRHYIHNVESFENGGNYVAVGRERFKPLKYGEEKVRNATVRLPPIWRSQRASSGRYRKVYEGEKQALKRIYVYKNGDNKTPARMILLRKKMLTNMELVLAALQDSGINFDFAISKLFTLDGKQIYSCDEIEHDARYVALERGSRFKPINYDGSSNFSPRNASTNFTRLPPIANRVNPAKISYSPRKNPEPPSKAKLHPPRQNKAKRIDKNQEKRTKQPIPPQDSIVSPFEDQNLQRESFSHVSLSVTPPPLDESPDFTMSENKAKNEDVATNSPDRSESPELAIPSDLEKLPEKEKETIGLKLYNASGMQSEWGEMVVENKKTVTDKLIDDVPAEEVIEEEITEDPEDFSKKKKTPHPPPHGKKGAKKQRPVRRIEHAKEANKEDKLKIKQKETDKSKDDEIAATANMLVERILQEEENEQAHEAFNNKQETAIENKRARSQSPEEELTEIPDEEVLDEEIADADEIKKSTTGKQEDNPPSPQPSVVSSQEDMNSEDEVQSTDEEENDDDDDDDDRDDNDEKDGADDEKSDEKESEEEKDDTDPQSDVSEAEEPASKENKTNKKVEEQRADPIAAKKNQIKQDHAKGVRRGKRVDNKA